MPFRHIFADTPPLLTACVLVSDDSLQTVRLGAGLMDLAGEHSGEIEIVLFSRSLSCTVARTLEGLGSPYLRLQLRADGAQDGLLSLAAFAQGRYVWFPPTRGECDLASLAAVLPHLRDQTHESFFFNSKLVTAGGGLGACLVTMNSQLVTCNATSGALALGLTSAFSRLGSAIMRRDHLLAQDTSRPLRDELAFPDVVRRVEAFAGTRMAILNFPLVRYRVEEDGELLTSRREEARLSGVQDYQTWTTGLMETYLRLISSSVLSDEDVSEAIERRRDGGSFRAIDQMLVALKQQVLLSLSPAGDRNRLSASDFEALTAWLLKQDAALLNGLQVLEALFQLRPEPRSRDIVRLGGDRVLAAVSSGGVARLDRVLSGAFDTLLQRRLATAAAPGQVEMYRGYAIHRHLTGFVAIRTASYVDPGPELAKIDPISRDGVVFVANSLQGLRAKLAQASWTRRARWRPLPERRTLANSLRAPTDPEAVRPPQDEERRAALARAQPPQSRPGTPAARELREEYLTRLGEFFQLVDVDWYLHQAGLPSDPSVPRRRSAALEHLAHVGVDIGLAPNPFFDESWYLAEYGEAGMQVSLGQVASAFDHYIQYGIHFLFDPGPGFSELGYLHANGDVAEALSNKNEGFRCGFEHWLLHGRSEGRNPLGIV